MADVLMDFSHDLGHCDHGLWASLQSLDEDNFSDCAITEQTYTETGDAALDFSDDEPCSSITALTPSKLIAHSEEIITDEPQGQIRGEYRTPAWFVVRTVLAFYHSSVSFSTDASDGLEDMVLSLLTQISAACAVPKITEDGTRPKKPATTQRVTVHLANRRKRSRDK